MHRKVIDRRRGASDVVFDGILAQLEMRVFKAGQRLVEAELCQQFGVGRNSVREALRRLEAWGVVTMGRNRGARIRALSLKEGLAHLEIAEVMTGLTARLAARNYPQSPPSLLRAARKRLVSGMIADSQATFEAACRHFFRTLVTIGGNSELVRLFAQTQVHTLQMQLDPTGLRQIRFQGCSTIAEAVERGDEDAAALAGSAHVRAVRDSIVNNPQLFLAS
jgi:DNA-binding GntR family transcriptional regulator